MSIDTVDPVFDSNGNPERIFRDEEGFTTSIRNYSDQVEYVRADLVPAPVSVPSKQELRDVMNEAEIAGSDVAQAIHAHLLTRQPSSQPDKKENENEV